MKTGKTYTKGNVIVEDIKVGDVHYEFEYGTYIQSEVISLPEWDEENEGWRWKSKDVKSERIIDYFVNPKYSHYGPNLYDYMAYCGCKQL